MHSLQDIMSRFNPAEDKYVSNEFQTFGIYLAEKLGDTKRKGLYIKYAKHIPRSILEVAYRFVIDSQARNKGALFMWKLKELGAFEKYPVPGKKAAPKAVKSGAAGTKSRAKAATSGAAGTKAAPKARKPGSIGTKTRKKAAPKTGKPDATPSAPPGLFDESIDTRDLYDIR